MAHHPYYLLAFVPLMYLRIRRSIGFRKFGGRRLFIPIGIFIAILSMVLIATVHHPLSLLADSIGCVLGASLGYLAIRQTEFEQREDALYYRTHIWIQVTVLALFLFRMSYRIYLWVEGNQGGLANSGNPMQTFQDPLTAGVLCLLFIYNLAYFSFVFRNGQRFLSNGGSNPA